MDLYSTNKKGKVITHLHSGGEAHFMCGLADDYYEDDEKVIGYAHHNTITCKGCLTQVKNVLRLAKKYGVK
tara:strand:- start:1555 stop:1767 length:213 start_codon:yes stop_codon:yes gene_type:complete